MFPQPLNWLVALLLIVVGFIVLIWALRVLGVTI